MHEQSLTLIMSHGFVVFICLWLFLRRWIAWKQVVVFPLFTMNAQLDFDQLLRCLFLLQKVSLKMRLFFPWNFWIGYRNLNRCLGLKFTNVNFPLLGIWHYWCMASLTFLWSIPLDQILQQFKVFCILENITLLFLQTEQLFMGSLVFQRTGRMGASVLVFHPRILLCKLKSYS